MKLSGVRAIISGANQGFGLEVAKTFLQEGALVTICARDEKKLAAARQELLTVAQQPSQLTCVTADVSQERDMENFVAQAIAAMGGIDVVIANAGVYGTKGAIEAIDWEEWSQAIDINLKGTVLLCKAALPWLKKQQAGKIILLSGGGATKPMPYLSAYAASKAAVVRFGETLAEECKEFNIDVNSIAPGALNTRLLEEILAAGAEKVGEHFYQQSLKQKEQGGSSLSIGAQLCVYLASAASNGITGKLISAIWDPWKDFQKFKEQLQTSDIYTLRRIVPADRQQGWG